MKVREFTKDRGLSRTWALLALVLLATVASGCQFLQNEFFYLCPTPKTPAQQDQDSGLRDRQTP